MSDSENVAVARDQDLVEIKRLTKLPGSEAEVPLPAPVSGRQPTGDQAVDEVLSRLEKVADDPLDTQIEVSEEVYRVLQGRLADLGKE